jgi:hypothetical protein
LLVWSPMSWDTATKFTPDTDVASRSVRGGGIVIHAYDKKDDVLACGQPMAGMTKRPGEPWDQAVGSKCTKCVEATTEDESS